MPAQTSALMLQFLEWVARGDRTYADAMDAWRTSCPRLSIWEDALEAGFIVVESGASRNRGRVRVSSHGQRVLAEQSKAI